MQEPRLAESVFDCPTQNQVCNDIGDQNAQACVLNVFSRKQHSKSASHQQLAVRALCLGLIFGREGRIEGWVGI